MRKLALVAVLGFLAVATLAEAAANGRVDVVGFAYSPANLVLTGGPFTPHVVEFANRDAFPHTATATPPLCFSTGTIAAGGAKSVEIHPVCALLGSVPYRCSFHPGMTGTITITG